MRWDATARRSDGAVTRWYGSDGAMSRLCDRGDAMLYRFIVGSLSRNRHLTILGMRN